MNTQSRELRQQRAAIIEAMHDLTEGTSFPAEAQKRWKELDRQQKELEVRVIREETNDLDAQMRVVVPPPQPQPGSGYPGFYDQRTLPTQENFSETRDLRPFASELESRDYKNAFGCYLRRGSEGLNTKQRNLLTDLTAEVRSYSGLNVATGSEGAYVVPIGFQRELEIKMKAYGRMRATCRLLNTATGNTLDWPAMDDTTVSGEFLNEAAPVSQENPVFAQIQFGSFLCSSKQVVLSVQLLQDSAFNLEDELSTAFAIRIGRRSNAAYTNGVGGSTEPEGLIHKLKNAGGTIVDATGSSSNDGVSGNTEANSIGSDDLEAVVAALDAAYRPNAKFLMHVKTIDKLRTVKDKYGRPLWASGLASATPDTIYGYPFDWNNDMDQVGAGKYPVVFGDFSKHVIRDVGGITVVRFNELFMSNHQIGFQSWLRTDSRTLQTAAFALLRNPLS